MTFRVFGSVLAASLVCTPAVVARQGGNNAEANLSPPVGAPLPGASGSVRLERHGSEQLFRVRGEDLDATGPTTPFEAWIESGVGTALFDSIGTMVFEVSSTGTWELELVGDGAAPAGLGVADLSDLAGRLVQVRGADDLTLFLEGTVPQLGSGGGGGGTEHGQVALQRPDSAPDDDALGRVRLRKHGNSQEFEVDVRNLPDVGIFSVRIETGVDTETYELVGPMEFSGSGRFELELEAEGAAPVELGVADVTDLAGRRVQVTDALDTVFLWGVLPALTQGQGQANFNRKAELVAPPGSTLDPVPSGFVRVRFNAPQGTSIFEVRTRRLPEGEFSVWIDDGLVPSTLFEVGTLTNGKLKLDTRKGDGLPLESGTLDDLAGLHIEVREGSGATAGAAVLEGDVP